jgi:type II restriction/modification system DNA methylase subunit YeeA
MCRLDGREVAEIHADLTAGNNIDLTQAQPLKENENCSFQGSQKIGAFDIDGELARSWLNLPNPNGRPNADVVKPSWNGIDATRRPRDGWIIDFGNNMTEADASLFEAPFEFVVQNVKPERIQNPRPVRAKYWWRHGDPQPAMRAAIAGLPRYIATTEVSKHRFFNWLNGNILPDKRLIVIARSDDVTFGILHSRFHELWSLRLGATLEDRPCYRPSTSFQTFPFPQGFTPRDTVGAASSRPPAEPTDGRLLVAPTNDDEHARHAAIAAAARKLNELRENWLNPPEWVDWVITPEEEKAGFPQRPVAKSGCEADLKKRTLTNLYNARPVWLDMAHKALDQTVAAAYGWTDYTPEMLDDEILRRLLALNLERAG